ncbi:MAG: kdpD 3 [Anaerosporomusa subterranea]|jgi:two-component system sensor histidine kinase KdpD|nr:kdpD 3 [Anaerosporomusa subterranea]
MAETKEEKRLNPDELLEQIAKESQGKLTVFLGAAAGVGKTFTMLEAAHNKLKDGVDIVIGWIETHGRQETEQMVVGLPRIEPLMIDYRGKSLAEMNIDAILARKPELVLVDELAHTNIPGSRHVRRFQDVEEILYAGIDVYTTLNVQHIESLNDVVAQITGVIVRETVPDHMVEQADTVQLIDIPPQDLIKRLKEGKVYVPGQAEQALRKFFRPGNISALRELALRFTANRVDKDVNQYMRAHRIEGPWPAAGRVMVCVSGSPFSAQLIRAARRLAGGLHADCLAVHIEAAKRRFPMGDKERDRVARNMQLAEELGAKTLTVVGNELTQEILEVARAHNVTAIVIGKPRHSRLWELWHGSVVDKLIRQSGGINVYVIQGIAEPEQVSAIKAANPIASPEPWHHYAVGLIMTALITLASLLLKNRIELVNIVLLYQLPVTLSAYWWGRWPSYFTALCSVITFDFFFIAPTLNFAVDDIRYLWSFVTFLIVAFVIGGRTELLRHEALEARQREKSTRALYEFSREIAAVSDLRVIATGMARQASETLDREVVILLPDNGGKLVLWGEHNLKTTGPANVLGQPLLDSAEAAVASWVYEHGQSAGRSTETLPGAKYLYIPLKAHETVVGVFGIQVIAKNVTPEQRRLMDAWIGLAAIAVERVKLSEQTREATRQPSCACIRSE